MENKPELILTFNTRAVNRLFKLQGGILNEDTDKLLPELFPNADPMYTDRAKVETDLNRKQLLPYIAFVLSGTDLVLNYSRQGGEKRLTGRRSIGVGGHIDHEHDASSSATNYGDMMDLGNAVSREIYEELGLPANQGKYRLHPVGWLNDDSDEVGRVHFARLYIAFISEETVNSLLVNYHGDAEIPAQRDLACTSIQSLKQEVNSPANRFENWSSIFIRLLANSSLL